MPPLMNPVWSSEMMRGRMGSRQHAKALASIFMLTGRRAMGQYDAQFNGSLSFLGMGEMEACVRVFGKEPVHLPPFINLIAPLISESVRGASSVSL